MARQHPRFLFSNPKNTKTEGPFVVHLLFPLKLYRMEWQALAKDYLLHEIEPWGERCSESETRKTYKATIKWINFQLDNGGIISKS